MHRPTSARRLLRSRTQASCHREVPCSASTMAVSSAFSRVLMASTSLNLVAQAGIDPHRDNIREQVEKDDQHRVKNGAAHDHGVIPIEGGLDEEAAEAGNLEDGL